MFRRFIPIVSLISLSLASAAAQQLSRADQRTADAAMNSIRPDATIQLGTINNCCVIIRKGKEEGNDVLIPKNC